MELLREIPVETPDGRARITLWHGDLTRLPAELAVDMLLVSAFPRSYAPLPGTLIGALERVGVSVQRLSVIKEADLRETSGFWLSKPLGETGLNIGRILCFEHAPLGTPTRLVGEVFRNLGPFLPESGARIATPLLASGNQSWPAEMVLPAMIGAASEWMRRGLEISELMIVEIDRARAEACATILDELQAEPAETPPAAPPAPRAPAPATEAAPERARKRFLFARSPGVLIALIGVITAGGLWLLDLDRFLRIEGLPELSQIAATEPDAAVLVGALVVLALLLFGALRYLVGAASRRRIGRNFRLYPPREIIPEIDHVGRYDVFISYTSRDKPAAEALVAAVRETWPEARVFDYRYEIDPSLYWQQKIDEAIENCGRIVALLSPEYFASPECQEEISIARLRNKRAAGGVLLPVYWRSLEGDLALWLQIINYADCRECDAALLQVFANKLRPGRSA